MKLDIIARNAQRAICKGEFLAKKHAPELLIAGGVISMVAAVGTAVAATTKLEVILDDTNAKLEAADIAVKRCKEDPEKFRKMYEDRGVTEYTEDDAAREKTIIYIQGGWKVVKLYLPTVTFMALSAGCVLAAHDILSKRNVALLAAYKASESSFLKYRDRVREEIGEERENDIYYGNVVSETIKEKVEDPETGKTKTVKRELKKTGGVVCSRYARFFDETNPNYNKPCKNLETGEFVDIRTAAERNRYFIECQLQKARREFKRRGHLFLNEAYDLLDMDRSDEGQLVGWIDDGETEIDFGIYDVKSVPERAAFINGTEASVLMDFNVQGVIYDLI